jgi:hypothetical protein
MTSHQKVSTLSNLADTGYQDIILDVETKKEDYAGSFYGREKPVKWSSLAHLLQRITSSSKPSPLTFASRMEYASSVQSSGDIAVPHPGHEKSPSPSVLVKSITYTWFWFILQVSLACLVFSFYYEQKLLIDFPYFHSNLYQILSR